MLVGVSVATYANTSANGFVWDDNDVIVNNPANRSLGTIPSLFASVDRTQTGQHTAYYRPLTRLTYVLDRQLFGESPAGYHLENVVLHALAVLALYLFVRVSFGSSRSALVAALLFAVHPVNSEAVDFLATRNTLLATLFTLVSLLAFQRARLSDRAGLLPVSWAAFFAALLSKETAAMLVAILPVLMRLGPGRPTARTGRSALLPFLAVLGAYLTLRWNALSGPVGASLDAAGLPGRLAANLYIVPRYLGLVLWPRDLSALHGVPADWTARWPLLLLAWLAICAAAFLVVRLRSPLASFGLAWFALNLLPVSGVVPIPSAPMAERYLYLPAAGLWMIAGDLVSQLRERRPRWRTALAAGVAALAFLGAAATVRRNRVWRDAVSFYSAMVEASPDQVLGHYSLGLAHQIAGDLPAARSSWERAVALDPGYFDVAAKLGLSYAQAGEWDSAERSLAAAVAASPSDAVALFNLAVVQDKAGKSAQALAHYRSFLDLQRQDLPAAVLKAQARIEALSGLQPPGTPDP